MKELLISIIIPIYNCDKFLRDCLDSIIHQTYQNLEIILVDDGSTDKSSEICDEYASHDSRIYVIHKTNEGAGKARNDGLRIANGEIISFIDSDDFISVDFYKTMYSFLKEDVDIVECDYKEFVDKEKVEFNDLEYNSYIYNTNEAMKEHIGDSIFRQLIWNKIYRRKVVEEIPFPEGKRIDDEYWMYQVIAKAKRLIHIDVIMYAYRQQDSSVMHNLSVEGRKQAIESRALRALFIKERFPELYNEAVYSVLMTSLYQAQYIKRTRKESYIDFLEYVNQELKPLDVQKIKIKGHSLTQRFWLSLSVHNFNIACSIRNLLGIGV